MSDELLHFFGNHPFLAILIIVFMALPIIGAISHIVLKAFGRKGIEIASGNQDDAGEAMTDDSIEGAGHNAPETKENSGK